MYKYKIILPYRKNYSGLLIDAKILKKYLPNSIIVTDRNNKFESEINIFIERYSID